MKQYSFNFKHYVNFWTYFASKYGFVQRKKKPKHNLYILQRLVSSPLQRFLTSEVKNSVSEVCVHHKSYNPTQFKKKKSKKKACVFHNEQIHFVKKM